MNLIRELLSKLSKCKQYSETYFHNKGKDLVPVKVFTDEDIELLFQDGTRIRLHDDFTYSIYVKLKIDKAI